MSLLRYLKPIDGLPDPRGSLSTTVSREAIAAANQEVQKELNATRKKRGQYKKYTPEQRSAIGRYSSQHGAAAAAKHFSRLWESKISESTVKSIKKGYLEELRKRPRADDGEGIVALPTKKRGRKLLLGEDLDTKVQIYLRKVREGGGAVSARIALAAARGILLKCNPSLLVQNGGPVDLNKFWAHSLMKRMKFVQRKATTSKSKNSLVDFAERKAEFLDAVAEAVVMEEIPAELVLNWDQTGIKLVPSSVWTMERQGEKRIEMVGVNDKRQITAVFCGTMLGEFLPIQLIYQGKTHRCHPKFTFPPDWHITHSPNHWSNECTMLDYITHIIVPYLQKTREYVGEDKTALVIIDNFKGQVTESVIQLLDDHNVHVCTLPPNTTDLLQPMDISVNKPAKDYLRAHFDEWYSQEVMKQLDGRELEDLEDVDIQPINLSMPVMKEVSAGWLVDMAEGISDNPQLIVNGFLRSGITGAFDGNLDEEENDSGNESSQEDFSSASDEEH
jgi:hypothetical protein